MNTARALEADLIVIGAGVLGSFHAYHAARRGKKVFLLEKDARPAEATVRNFGQVVPSGMRQGTWQQYGRRSLEIYQELQSRFDLSIRANGTVYFASDSTEETLLQELALINAQQGYFSELRDPAYCLAQYPGLKASYCRGGLFFPQEVTVEPDRMIHSLLGYLGEQWGVAYHPHTLVRAVEEAGGKCRVEDSRGQVFSAEQVIICNGRDFEQLFPEIFYQEGIQVSKLQMMQTVPQPGLRIKGSVLTGLSIRRYESFTECPSYYRLKAHEIDPLYQQWGIHILFKQALDGSVIIGDSHQYADARCQLDLGYEIQIPVHEAIIKAAQEIYELPSWELSRCWNGFYSQSQKGELFDYCVSPHIRVITAIGGKGMTAGPGLAEATIDSLYA